MIQVIQLHHDDKKLVRWGTDVTRSVNSIASLPLLDGRLVELFDIEDGETVRIGHGLNRPLRGWLIVDLLDPSTTGRIERVTVTGVNDATHLVLKATGWGATIRVAVWVF